MAETGGWTCQQCQFHDIFGTNCEIQEKQTTFHPENLKGRANLEDLGTGRRVLLKQISKYGVSMHQMGLSDSELCAHSYKKQCFFIFTIRLPHITTNVCLNFLRGECMIRCKHQVFFPLHFFFLFIPVILLIFQFMVNLHYHLSSLSLGVSEVIAGNARQP